MANKTHIDVVTSPTCRDHLEDVVASHAIPATEILSRLLEHFAKQPDEVKRALVAGTPGGDDPGQSALPSGD